MATHHASLADDHRDSSCAFQLASKHLAAYQWTTIADAMRDFYRQGYTVVAVYGQSVSGGDQSLLIGLTWNTGSGS